MHLVEDHVARAAFDDATERWAGTSDAWEAATWVILRDPEIGTAISEDGKLRSFTYDGTKSTKQPTITLLYEISVHEMIIRAAKFSEPKYVRAGRA